MGTNERQSIGGVAHGGRELPELFLLWETQYFKQLCQGFKFKGFIRLKA